LVRGKDRYAWLTTLDGEIDAVVFEPNATHIPNDCWV